MLDTINVNKGKVTAMYRNGEKIWKMPRAGLALPSGGLVPGMSSITGIAYPSGADVNIKVERNGQVILNATQVVSNLEFTQGFKNRLQEDDEVTIRVTAPGFAPYVYSITIY